jgi:hypothetical protein
LLQVKWISAPPLGAIDPAFTLTFYKHLTPPE